MQAEPRSGTSVVGVAALASLALALGTLAALPGSASASAASLAGVVLGLNVARFLGPGVWGRGLGPPAALVLAGGALYGLLGPPADPPAPGWGLAPLAGLAGLGWLLGPYAQAARWLPGRQVLAAWSRHLTQAALLSLSALLLAPFLPGADLWAGRLLSSLQLACGLAAMYQAWSERNGTVDPRPPAPLAWTARHLHPGRSLGESARLSFGIDLRTTWAVTFLRAAAPRLLAVLALLGWVSTGLVRVGPEEVAVVERLGRALPQPVGPGLRVGLPWPLEVVRRVPVGRVLTLKVGHEEDAEEEEAESGPEDTFWARSHGGAEYTLVLGDGRDLVTVDGLLHWRIVDPSAYLYASAEPEALLRAFAYEAVMRHASRRSLDEVLSENVALFSEQVRQEVATRAAAANLGVEPVTFSLAALHPPFAVAKDYQEVVSAQIDRETARIRAEGYQARELPTARASAAGEVLRAQAEVARRLGTARGEVAAFDAVRRSWEADPELFEVRRRLETLETNLAEKPMTVLDRRIEAQGGALWILQ